MGRDARRHDGFATFAFALTGTIDSAVTHDVMFSAHFAIDTPAMLGVLGR